MKKIFAILITVAMLLSLGTVLAAAELPAGISFTPGKYGVEDAADFTPAGDFAITWDADAASKLDLSDGNMEDWAAAGYNMVTIDANNMVSWVGDHTTAPAGWSISTYFVADGEWFYIGFYVTDPDFVYGSGTAYDGDAFQVCIDFGGLLGEQLKTDPDVLTNPKNIFYSFSCAEDGAPIQIMRQESDQDGWLSEENGDGVKGAARKTETGWSAEFALSWQQLYDDYVWKAWKEDPKIYVGGDEDRPLKIGCCLYYLNRVDPDNRGNITWAAGSTNGIADDNGVPQVSWTAWDNGLNLALTYEDGMEFVCEGIVALDKTVTIPPETTAAETTAPEEPDTTAEPETEPATQAPAQTTGAADDGATTTTAPATSDDGCASVIGMGAVAVLAAAAAVVALKKKD